MNTRAIGGLITGLAMVVMGGQAHAAIDGTIDCSGVSGCTLYAEAGFVNTPDGNEIYGWGFSDVAGKLRYPGPTIDATMGETVTVSLTNNLPDPDGAGPKGVDPVSIVFAGQTGVTYSVDGGTTFQPVVPALGATGHKESLTSMAPEAAAGQTVIYQFTPTRPGTYYYNSGTFQHKHVDMGLVGAMVIRSGLVSAGGSGRPLAYTTEDSAYDVEYLQFTSSIDPDQHRRVERGLDYEASAYQPNYFFVNGRNYPDTLSGANAFYLPNQPDSALLGIYPGERALFRTVNVDRLVHPMHHHANHARIVALNGHEMTSGFEPGRADLAVDRFSHATNSGQTVDSIFAWCDGGGDPFAAVPCADGGAAKFGWDVYGNDAAHPVPVVTPPAFDNPNIAFNYGEAYSGSPYLGKKGMLPGDVQSISINQHGEHYMVFHSHFEYELENAGQRPGGMLTVIMICMPGEACAGHDPLTNLPIQ
ncbi:MAG: hypothetical protein HZA24_05000 [Nitrospirae bacterium]|nr:hypothetical protein [Nitrospirota bacterium]